MMLAAFSFLGLNWTTIVIHFVVFAILVVGLTFLVYKPVLKFVKKRQESIQQGLDEGQAMRAEGEAVKAEYEAKIQSSQQEADAMRAAAQAECARMKEQALSDAKRESEAILRQARQEAQQEKEAAGQAMRQEVGGLAVTLAREILQREISAEENEQLIEECLTAWSDHD